VSINVDAHSIRFKLLACISWRFQRRDFHQRTKKAGFEARLDAHIVMSIHHSR
jgi:hypothetical protein